MACGFKTRLCISHTLCNCKFMLDLVWETFSPFCSKTIEGFLLRVLTFWCPNFQPFSLYIILKSRCRVISLILDHNKYVCSILQNFYLQGNFLICPPQQGHHPAFCLIPFCKWKALLIAALYVNFHFLSFPVPSLTLSLILFNTQSFPRGWRHAVSAVDRQKQRGTCRAIRGGLSVYERMTLYCPNCIREQKGKLCRWGALA